MKNTNNKEKRMKEITKTIILAEIREKEIANIVKKVAKTQMTRMKLDLAEFQMMTKVMDHLRVKAVLTVMMTMIIALRIALA